MVTTSRDDVAETVRKLRSHGMTTLTLDRHKGHAFSYDVVALGYNYRMSELNAALGLVQLKHLERRNDRRRDHVEYYRRRLEHIEPLSAPFAAHPGLPACHIMPVLLPAGADRHALMSGLRARGVQSSIHYRPIDTFSAYQEAGLGPFPHLVHTHEIGHRELTLPLYPSMSHSQIDYVVEALEAGLTAVPTVAR
jgi:dTDP-4-amino-4,6-dideoxygalactose transaminase